MTRIRPFARVLVVIAFVLVAASLAHALATSMASQRDRLVSALLLMSKEAGVDSKALVSDAEFERFKRTQLVLIKSRVVCDAAVARPEVAELKTIQAQPDAPAWLEQKIEVDFPQDGDVLRVSMRGKEVDDLKVIINGVTETYFGFLRNQFRHDRSVQRLDVLRHMYSPYREAIKNNQMLLEAMRKQASPKERAKANEDQSINDQMRIEALRDLRRVCLEKTAIQVKLNRKKAEKGTPEIDKAIVQLEEQLAVLAAQEELLRLDAEGPRRSKEDELLSKETSTIEGQLAADEQVAQRIAHQIGELELQLKLPIGVRLIQPAAVSETP